MSAQAVIKTALEDDTDLGDIATGGIWDWDETGRMGLSPETTPDAYQNGIIQPCILVKGRGERPDGQIADASVQQLSTREIVEIWFYQDTGYDQIALMKASVYGLLHEGQLNGTVVVRWAGSPFSHERDDAMGNISVERDDYQVVALKSS